MHKIERKYEIIHQMIILITALLQTKLIKNFKRHKIINKLSNLSTTLIITNPKQIRPKFQFLSKNLLIK
jgi:hypothetical protein